MKDVEMLQFCKAGCGNDGITDYNTGNTNH